ncbi:MAG: hypothetical protein ACR2NU_13260 [Aeoliella sp.]
MFFSRNHRFYWQRDEEHAGVRKTYIAWQFTKYLDEFSPTQVAFSPQRQTFRNATIRE